MFRGSAQGWLAALLELFQFGGDLGDFAFQPFDIRRIVHLLTGAGKLLPHFLQSLIQQIDALFGFFIHDRPFPLSSALKSPERFCPNRE